METISTDNVNVRGVTLVDNKLFVLLQRDVNQVAVYSINDYQLLCHLNLPYVMPDNHSDLTSCVRYKRIYMSDYANRCIHKYNLVGNATSKWEVGLPRANPICLSVTPNCNLLVTCRQPSKLAELSATSGQCVREIALQSDIDGPCHGVQLTSGQYVVCCVAFQCDSLHGVCIVDDDGKVTRSYGGQRGSHTHQLNWPSHLAVDESSQFIFVADCFNDRVVMLSATLEFVRDIREGLSEPQRLYLHHSTRRLYVGQWLGDVVVIQL